MQPELTKEYLESQGLSLSIVERFWSGVYIPEESPETQCWTWTMGTTWNGYGRIFSGLGKTVRVHRVSWILHFGPIPEGKDILHHCDNPPCMRPDHLFPGDAHLNHLDCMRKGRTTKGRTPSGAENRKGENASNVKLTWKIVNEIRELWPTLTQQRIADTFGVTKTNIRHILKRKTWV